MELDISGMGLAFRKISQPISEMGTYITVCSFASLIEMTAIVFSDARSF